MKKNNTTHAKTTGTKSGARTKNAAESFKKTKIKAIASVLLCAVILIAVIFAAGVLSVKDDDGLPADFKGSVFKFSESIEKVDNPDQGFYRPIYVKVTEDGVAYNKNIVTANTQLYHLRADISAFSGATNGSADKPLTEAALSGFKELLQYLKANGKSAIVRFAYDAGFNGNTHKEPSFETMLAHTGQFCGVINLFYTTVTAVEVGMIGPWGEMHTSDYAKAEYITPLVDKFLTETAASGVPVLVRTPKMIYNYLGITVNDIAGYEIPKESKAYRLGLFNDGYLGSDTDLGTYTNRATEVEFLAAQNAHLPYGGEVVVPGSNLHDIDKCLPEMYLLGLSYLNIEWNNNVIDKWKNSTYTRACGGDAAYYGQSAFTYIQNRLGYRFYAEKCVVQCLGNYESVKVTLNVKNAGFGNMLKSKKAKLLFVNAAGEVVLTREVGDFVGAGSVGYTAELGLENGDYGVYICVYGDTAAGNPIYTVRFANGGADAGDWQLWNAELSANFIGKISVEKSA